MNTALCLSIGLCCVPAGFPHLLFFVGMWGVERIFEHRIRQQIKIDDMQFGFMKGKGTTDAIFMARQMQENFIELKVKSSILVLWIWRKLLIGCQEKC